MNFTDIPIDDVKYFLAKYDQPIPQDFIAVYNAGIALLNLVIAHPQVLVPEAITDWCLED
jgi:hypothetical protein